MLWHFQSLTADFNGNANTVFMIAAKLRIAPSYLAHSFGLPVPKIVYKAIYKEL
jgi:hypothetical protein